MQRQDTTVARLACRLSVAFVVALAFAPLIREITAGLTGTIGERWPFAIEHCRTPDTPGCEWVELSPPVRRLAVR